jgi:FkbM family methyltransferase
LSAHPHDVVTAFVVVAREDYGRIEPNTIVVDIGANIGVYSLYAAYMGARVVYAYEPNAQAYEILLRNIALNGFEHVIFPYRLAVACTSDNMVSIPVEASPYNRTLADDICEHWDSVGTVTLERILIDNGIDYADVLKIDCEGAEYEVLFGTSGAVLSRFRNIRMEYHPGPIDALLGHLQRHRFFLVERNEESATIWVTRSRDSYGVDHRIMEVDRQN